MTVRRLGPIALILLALAGGLLACEDPTPPGPTPTPTIAPSPTPVPTRTPVPTPTETPLPTATEGPVRTPVSGAAGPEFMVALGALDAAPSYRYTLQLSLGGPDARYLLSGYGQYQAPGGYDTNFSALGFNSEILTLSDTTYVRTYGIWRQGEPDPVTFPMGAPPNIRNTIGLLTYARDAALAGEGNETLNGKPSRHFRFSLPAGGAIAPPAGAPAPTGGDLWTDPETHRPQRGVFTFAGAGTPVDNDGTFQIDFSDYGAAVVLTPPPTPAP